MHHTTSIGISIALIALFVTACSPTPEDHVRKAAQEVTQAILYKDVATLYGLHAESTGHGVFCDARFKALFDKTRAQAQNDPSSCKDAYAIASMEPEKKKTLEDSLVLLSELLHFHCTHPSQADATCPAFARDIFRRKAEQSRFWTNPPTSIDITHVKLQDPVHATAYVDVIQTPNAAPERITLHFQKTPEKTWQLTTYPW